MSTAVVLTRWKCGHCGRSFASRSYANNHEGACTHNPATHSCTTCAHFMRHPCCDAPSAECGCGGLNECAIDAFSKENWECDLHTDWRRQCPVWESAS